MRVGIDGRAFQPGFKGHHGRGIGLYARELVRALARLGAAELVLFFDPWLPVDERGLPPEARRAWYPRGPFGRPLHHHLTTQLVVPAAGRSGFDAFHYLAMQDAPLWLPPRSVVTVHDVILFHMRDAYDRGKRFPYRLVRALERAVVRRAPLLLTDSGTSRDDIVRLLAVPPGRVRVATLGVDERFRPRPRAEVDAVTAKLGLPDPYFLYLGGIDARKNVPALLTAYARLRAGRAAVPDLAIAGRIEREPEFPALAALARELGLGERLRRTGYVADEDLPALLSGATAFVFPSRYEGFGLPPLEALACGTPVVASHGGSLREVLGEAALLVPPDDPAALTAALARVLDDPALVAELRRRGPARAAGFTWERTARATLDAYREVAAR